MSAKVGGLIPGSSSLHVEVSWGKILSPKLCVCEWVSISIISYINFILLLMSRFAPWMVAAAMSV